MLLLIGQAVGRDSPNRPQDVKLIHKQLMDIGKIPCYANIAGTMDGTLSKGIEAVQRHFMLRPDGVISPGGSTLRWLSQWKEKTVGAGVQLPGALRTAWEWVSPLLPEGSYCSSGYRSAAEQRAILHKFYRDKFSAEIIAKYSRETYDEVAKDLEANEERVLDMVRGVGQAIAAPGASMHQKSKAVDIGGPPNIDDKQVQVVKLVAHAHPDLFSGFVLKERNGCVHFEIR